MKYACVTMVLKCNQDTMRKSLFLLGDLSELWRVRLDEIVDKYNKTYRTIKLGACVDYVVEHNVKDPKFKVGHHKYQNANKFLQRATLQIGLRKSLGSRMKSLLELSMKNCRKPVKQNLGLKKVMKCMSIGRAMIIQ